MSERDTQFAISARQVMARVLESAGMQPDPPDIWSEEIAILAQYAYDVAHRTLFLAPTLMNVPEITSIDEAIRAMPDFPVWPEVSEHGK